MEYQHHLELHEFEYELSLLSIKLIERPSGKVYSYREVKVLEDTRDRFLTLYIFLQKYLLYFEKTYYSLTDKIIYVPNQLDNTGDERLVLALNAPTFINNRYIPWAESTPLRRVWFKFSSKAPICPG